MEEISVTANKLGSLAENLKNNLGQYKSDSSEAKTLIKTKNLKEVKRFSVLKKPKLKSNLNNE